ncbi:MAG: N-acetyl-gamma-glutamyl-phosphate reductase [Alcanivoracaceae bacterium]|nr:N-acetyl-gamma-glutamyl-phosphate reductase [Alcanivoracaceae bacterium]
MSVIKVAVVGARGYVGFELIKLIDEHPLTKLVAAYSREYVGKAIYEIVTSFSDKELCYCADSLESLADRQLDVIFLALPNDIAARYTHKWLKISKHTCIIDLSSDFRFDSGWVYGQPETCADNIVGQSLIANPGCYATASQLGLLPVIDMLDGVPNIFGVSGYSGAGSKPGAKNNPKRLSDNLMAYTLVDHIHEREVSRVVGREVYFMPHVASFFRGIHLTISIKLNKTFAIDEIKNKYAQFYKEYQLIHVTTDIPEVKDVQNTHHVNIGGFTIKDQHLVLCVTIDNLLKGAATQAIQNMNLALSEQYDLEINTGIV